MAKRKPKIYGNWAGNPKGTPEDVTRCIKNVYTPGSYSHGHQCTRKRGFGPDGLHCKQHDPVRIKKIEDKKSKAYDEKWAIRKATSCRINALAKLSDGIPTKELHLYKLVKAE